MARAGWAADRREFMLTPQFCLTHAQRPKKVQEACISGRGQAATWRLAGRDDAARVPKVIMVGGNAEGSEEEDAQTLVYNSITSSACTKRPTCTRCRRPSRVCLCTFLSPARLPLPPHLSVIILQHAAEGKSNPVKATVSILGAVIESQGGWERGPVETGIGEARTVREEDEACNGGLALISCSKGRLDGVMDARLARAFEEEGTVLLYPAEGARDVRELLVDRKKEWREDSGKRGGEKRGDRKQKITLIVLDGTWESARRMYARNERLHGLPTVCLPLPSSLPSSLPFPAPSSSLTPRIDGVADIHEQQIWLARPPIFTVRKEPSRMLGKGGRSTAEAVALAIFLLGEKKVAEAIIDAVQRANGMQLSLTDPANVRHRRERKGYVENLYSGSHEHSLYHMRLNGKDKDNNY